MGASAYFYLSSRPWLPLVNDTDRPKTRLQRSNPSSAYIYLAIVTVLTVKRQHRALHQSVCCGGWKGLFNEFEEWGGSFAHYLFNCLCMVHVLASQFSEKKINWIIATYLDKNTGNPP